MKAVLSEDFLRLGYAGLLRPSYALPCASISPAKYAALFCMKCLFLAYAVDCQRYAGKEAKPCEDEANECDMVGQFSGIDVVLSFRFRFFAQSLTVGFHTFLCVIADDFSVFDPDGGSALEAGIPDIIQDIIDSF
jgi:hypothetical protein